MRKQSIAWIYLSVPLDACALRHEFLGGEIYAMAGGTSEHAVLAASVLRHIGNQLPADQTVLSSAARCCRPFKDPLAATNPTLVLEVTSPYDRGAKLEQYRGLGTL